MGFLRRTERKTGWHGSTCRGCASTRRKKLHLEPLEDRVLLSVSAEEQHFVYLLNRARHNPVQYQQEAGLSVDLAYVTPRGPLAVNDALFASAKFHANEMAAYNYFDHQSHVTGDWPNKMVRDQGYVLNASWSSNANYVESIAAGTFYSQANDPLKLLIEDTGLSPPGHRNHLLGIDSFNADDREIGVGHGFNNAASYRNYWAIHGTRTDPADRFLTGVVFNDGNANGRYDPNEGLANVTVSANGLSTTTNGAGGWSLRVGKGAYSVTAQGGGFVGSASANATVSDNVEVDFLSGQGLGVVDFDHVGGQANHAPTVAAPLADRQVNQNSPNVVFDVAAAFTDLDLPAGDALTWQIADNDHPTLLGAALNGSTLTLSFVAGASGIGDVTVRATDKFGASVEDTFRVTVLSPTNTIPLTRDNHYVLSTNAANAVTAANGVLKNDFDADGNSLSAVLIHGPKHGTVNLQADGSFTYTKGTDFKGSDTFSYRADDGISGANAATVTVYSHEASLVRKLYLQVLKREPEPAGLEYWTNRINRGEGYGVIAAGIFESDERLDPIVRRMYTDYLLRDAEPAGLAFWRDVWRTSGSSDAVVAGIVSSPEFFQSAGGSSNGWVTELYRRLLSREPEAAGLQYWIDALEQRGMSRDLVVLGFVLSDENFGALIEDWHQQYLARSARPDELDRFLNELRHGLSQRAVQISLIDSDEYKNSPATPSAGTANSLDA